MHLAGTLTAALLFPCLANAACLTLGSHPDNAPLLQVALPADDPSFMITYVHSVTRTPVMERYAISGSEIVETEMRFEQHGPGLPTEADKGGTFSHGDGGFVVTMDRHFPTIVMRVHRDQSPRLATGTRSLDLAQWGNRALLLGVIADPCTGS
jgi:hypothetical protein